MTCLTDEGDAMVDGCLLHGEVWSWDNAIDVWNVCAVGRGQVDEDSLFTRIFPSGDTDGAADYWERCVGKWAYPEPLFDLFGS